MPQSTTLEMSQHLSYVVLRVHLTFPKYAMAMKAYSWGLHTVSTITARVGQQCFLPACIALEYRLIHIKVHVKAIKVKTLFHSFSTMVL